MCVFHGFAPYQCFDTLGGEDETNSFNEYDDISVIDPNKCVLMEPPIGMGVSFG